MGPFIKVNCTALPADLLESELFGHEKGAFTGAAERRIGAFELAHNGTLLLDEIGDMEKKLQGKILHAIEDKEFRRVGGRDLVRVDVRIIAATNRDLREAIARREFREDLFYRLNVAEIRIPPLRQRRGEIIGLATELLRKHASPAVAAPEIGPDLERALIAFEWPGNVRQLENVMRRYLVDGDEAAIVAELSEYAAHVPPPVSIAARSPFEHLDKSRTEAEAALIMKALESTCWNRKRAAASLNMPYKNFLYRMKRLKIGLAVTVNHNTAAQAD